jgi:AAA+ superfamily predicted ATPase
VIDGAGRPMSIELPQWAAEMRDLFRSGSVAQFILHGNVFDVVPAPGPGGGRLLSLNTFLDEVMFERYDTVLHYDRGRGIRATRGAEEWSDWLRLALGDQAGAFAQTREPGAAMELIDRYLLRTLNLQSLTGREAGSRKIAVVIDFAEFVVPRGDAIQLGGAFSANVVKVLGWANDPAILQSNIVTVLLTEGLHDLNDLVVENPHATSLRIPLPTEAEMEDYLEALVASTFPELQSKCEVPLDALARRLTGLSRVGARTVISLALKNSQTITAAWLSNMKKEMIERECQGLLEFVESPFTLENLAGHDAVKVWLREDARLLQRGVLYALPMGYLITGRIGTGKTFLVQCWAGELGIPCVVFKNFRDRWVGATESNLEKIFSVLRALGQVVVFVDEADQAAGKRESGSSDSGLSGRVYSMLAKEMSDTRNRGRIIWVFATSRPDLLEVDLKRQGRLDVHIPLFPPETRDEMRALLLAVARKLKVPLEEGDLPDLPETVVLGGNEVEGILVRALRTRELSPEPRRTIKDILSEVFQEVRPSAHTRKLEYMDLVAVKECTDVRFLPPRFRDMPPERLEERIDELRRFA